MNSTQWWPGWTAALSLLILIVPTVFMAVRRHYIPPAARASIPTWVVISDILGPTILLGIGVFLTWLLDSIWFTLAGFSLYQLSKLVRHFYYYPCSGLQKPSHA